MLRSLLVALLISGQAHADENIADQYPGSMLYQKPVEVIPHVWSAIGATAPPTYENSGHNNNLSFIVTGDGVVVVNGGAAFLLAQALHEEIKKITQKEVQINIYEIKRPELDAKLVGDMIASQLAARISFRRAMKTAIASTMRMGAEGVKIMCSGRLGGAEMARTEQYKEGRIPLQTLRANIDYALSESKTIYGVIGVKVWIFKGEIYGKVDLSPNAGMTDRRKGRRDRDRRNR